MTVKWDNQPTVVVVMVPCNGGLLMIRRALPDGYGKVAIPGGFQVKPDSWQLAGAKEVFQETGVVVDPAKLRQVGETVTTPDGSVNLLFCEHPPVDFAGEFTHDEEILEVFIAREPVETAFPLHTQQVREFFERHSR